MPKIRRSRKPPPEGWELIEPTLDELNKKMREAEAEPHEGKRKVEALWPIFKIHHQRSRYIYDLFYRRKAISRELYDYCIKEGNVLIIMPTYTYTQCMLLKLEINKLYCFICRNRRWKSDSEMET